MAEPATPDAVPARASSPHGPVTAGRAAWRLPAPRRAWFQLHWLLGITAGTVLMVVGVTGGLLSFEAEALRALNPGIVTVTPRAEAPLGPGALVRRVEAASGGRVAMLGLSAAPDRAARAFVMMRDPAGGRPRRVLRYVDPVDGALLGTPRGEAFFHTVRELHRWLLAGPVEGRLVVGVSTLALVILSATGLYLRWPRRALQWRAWFRIDLRLRGRALLWRLHAVIGTWVLPLYLLMGLTGLYWSFDWYRDGLYALTGAPRPGGEAGPRAEGPPRAEGGTRPAPIDLDRAWAAFLRERPDYGTAMLRLPANGPSLRVTYTDAGAPEEARSTLAIDAAGAVVENRRFEAQPLGHRLMGGILALHGGRYWGVTGTVLLMVASLLMPLFGVTGWMLYLERRRLKAARRPARAVVQPSGEEARPEGVTPKAAR